MKRIVYNIVGTSHLIQEKVKELLEDLIQNQHYTEEEGKRIIDDFFFNIQSNIDTAKLSIDLKIDDFLKKLNIDSIASLKDSITQIVKDIEDNPLLPAIIKHKK